MHKFSYLNAKPAKTCGIVRYGGFGDCVQTSSILPWLKQQGYHITLYTTPLGAEVLKHDPHIDSLVAQGEDDIPNMELGAFWRYTAKKYDKWINLSESIESTLLALPGHMNHGWPHEIRHQYMNVNYMKFIHEISGVPMPPQMMFYPTQDELHWAHEEYYRMRGPVILWSLSGSSVHKVWPYIDYAFDNILSRNDGTNIVLVGDEQCKKLEEGWENTPRVHCKSGEWTIRQSMTFAQVCDLVVGPETGILNSVALSAVPKVVMLSHSSVENLTRDWINCISLEPLNVKCYPCHQIHFNFNYCQKNDKTHVSECQSNISVNAMIDAIDELMNLHSEAV